MSDSGDAPDAPHIVLYGSEFEVRDDVIHVNHSLNVSQAERLQRRFPGAMSLQEALRMAAEFALEERD